ncbi:MAG TPA: HEAT repeat domain-containing protein [Ktedonobacteraceae bacterium]|nr:HEAT repeat domain-containing protein [Ktedonobacteraceae bacterium]
MPVSILLGAGTTALLICLVILVAWLLALSHSASGTAVSLLAVLLTAFFHSSVFLIGIVVALAVFSLLFWLIARPRAISAYLREAAAGQEPYHQRYTPFALALPAQNAQGQGAQPSQLQPAPVHDLFQQDTSVLLIGEAGMGKTMALREFLYEAAHNRRGKVRGRERLPLYVPLQHYALYLKARLRIDPETGQLLSPPVTLLDFLRESNLPGLSRLAPFLQRLSGQGRLLLLCDGLDEVDPDFRPLIVDELVEEIRQSDNRVVLACRKSAFQAQEALVQLVQDSRVEWLELQPLDQEQVRSFVESAALNAAHPWQHTAGQVMQGIISSRLRTLSTNPMMLSCLVEVVDKVGVRQMRQLDTRGALLRAFITQIIEQQRATWRQQLPATQSIIDFLGRLAYVARLSGSLSAIQLPLAGEAADALQTWLDEHPAPYPFRTNAAEQTLSFVNDDVSLLLQFAQEAGLLILAADGVLSFSHELLAEYCIAEYFALIAQAQGGQYLLREDVLADVERWCGPIALWAGLVSDPLALAGRLQLAGRGGPSLLPAFALGLVAAGVRDVVPRTKTATLTPLALPESMEEALTKVVQNQAARENLVQLCTLCAQNGGEEIYSALPLLLPIPGIADLIARLDNGVVPDLLCDYLVDIVNRQSYDAQVRSLLVVLGRFGDAVVDRVSVLSQPGGGRSERLRFAAIQILGRVGTERAIEQVLPFLGSSEQSIARAALNALVRPGPQVTLPAVLPLLENSTPTSAEETTQLAVLDVLARFLQEPKAERQLTTAEYQHILSVLLTLLSSDYTRAAALQEKAHNLLVWQGRQATNRGAIALDLLIQALASRDEAQGNNAARVLLTIGQVATERLLAYLNSQPPNAVRVRIIEVLKGSRDQQALPALLQLVADPSPTVQQQVAATLAAFAPASISGLLDLVASSPDEMVASRAAQVLVSIGNEVVEPVAASLHSISPERARLLVEVLEEVPDTRAIPALVSLLQEPQAELLLAVTAMRALGQIPDQQVVPPLLSMLEQPQAQLYEEAITSLGHLGEIALPDLLAALDVWQEPKLQERTRRAILCMVPFPGEALMEALGASSDTLAGQIMRIFGTQGPEAAQTLVNHLLDTDSRVNACIHQVLDTMPGPIVVPALLEVLNQPAWVPVVSPLLLKYPEAVAPLVSLLSDPQRDTVAASILPQFGMDVLDPLLASLTEDNLEAQEYAGRVIVSLVRQKPEEIDRVVQLFGNTLSPQAQEVLLDTLTGPLADVSLPALMSGLEDARLVEGVSEALVRMESEEERTGDVLGQLLQALRVPERQWGAERALVKIGAPAVQSVGSLITDSAPSVAMTARRILMHIGTPAFPFIWAASSDTSNAARREAALSVLNEMPATVIQDGLLWNLMSDQPQDVAMAVALLLERIHTESRLAFEEQEMIPSLLAYVEKQGGERTLQRILALLLFIGGQNVTEHLVQELYRQPEYTDQIIHAFLLLGRTAAKTLEDILHDPNATLELRAAVVGTLGTIEPTQSVTEYVRNISDYGYGVTARPEGLNDPDLLNVALRALGGLLVGGHWDVSTLLDLRTKNMETDLATALLGWRYGAYIHKLLGDLRNEREAHQMEVRNLHILINTEQQENQRLQEELEQVSQEHNLRLEELEHEKRQHQELRNRLDYREQQRQNLERENDHLKHDNELLRREISLLRRENDQLKQEV